MSDTRVAFVIQTTADEAKFEMDAAAAAPGYEIESVTKLPPLQDPKLVEGRFVDPVSILGATTLTMIAIRLVNHWLKSRERGVQIDLRTQPITISQLANVPAGVMVIIDKDGQAKIHREAYDAPEQILPTLQAILASAPAAR